MNRLLHLAGIQLVDGGGGCHSCFQGRGVGQRCFALGRLFVGPAERLRPQADVEFGFVGFDETGFTEGISVRVAHSPGDTRSRSSQVEGY